SAATSVTTWPASASKASELERSPPVTSTPRMRRVSRNAVRSFAPTIPCAWPPAITPAPYRPALLHCTIGPLVDCHYLRSGSAREVGSYTRGYWPQVANMPTAARAITAVVSHPSRFVHRLLVR